MRGMLGDLKEYKYCDANSFVIYRQMTALHGSLTVRLYMNLWCVIGNVSYELRMQAKKEGTRVLLVNKDRPRDSVSK